MSVNTSQSNDSDKKQNSETNDRKIILLIGMGLNGINAGGWLPPADTKDQAEEIYNDLWSLLESIDTFIIGHTTFQMWEKYWPLQANNPSSSAFGKKFSVIANQMHKIVFSTSLKTTSWQNSRIVDGDISTEIARIKKLPGKNIALVGGPGIAQTFVKLNLFDEYQLYLHQVIFPSGKLVLGELDKEKELKLVDIQKFQGGGLRLHYKNK